MTGRVPAAHKTVLSSEVILLSEVLTVRVPPFVALALSWPQFALD